MRGKRELSLSRRVECMRVPHAGEESLYALHVGLSFTVEQGLGAGRQASETITECHRGTLSILPVCSIAAEGRTAATKQP